MKIEKLGFWTLTALVTGNMVGSGIFMLPASLARVGSISLVAWVFTSIGAIALALVFSKMSSLITKNGGPYAYSQAGFGNFIGFQTAYNYWIMVLLGNAGVAVAFIGYMRVFIPALADPHIGTLIAILVIWIFTFINIAGIRFAGITQLITTLLKFIPLLLIATFGWAYFHPEYLTHNFNVSSHSNFSAFSYAATLTLWTFIGLESATIPSDSVKNPLRNIPLATIVGTALSAILYIASTAALMGMLPISSLVNSTSPFATATAIMFGPLGEWITALGAIVSCLGALNGWTLVQGQIPMAAADDNLFPKIFSIRNQKNVPATGLIVSSLIVTVMLIITTSPSLIDQFNSLILIATVTSLLAYFYTSIAEIIILPKKQPFVKNTTHIIIAIAAAAYSAWAFLGSGTETIFYVTILVLSSIPLYAWICYRNSIQLPL